MGLFKFDLLLSNEQINHYLILVKFPYWTGWFSNFSLLV